MQKAGRRWSVQDRYGNDIYLTQERWNHIIDETNHPEMQAYEAYLKRTLRIGRRTQDALNPSKYRYVAFYEDLPGPVNTLVVIVLFGVDVDKFGHSSPNNYVVTAFLKHIRPKR
jgi:hypothetical protein